MGNGGWVAVLRLFYVCSLFEGSAWTVGASKGPATTTSCIPALSPQNPDEVDCKSLETHLDALAAPGM